MWDQLIATIIATIIATVLCSVVIYILIEYRKKIFSEKKTEEEIGDYTDYRIKNEEELNLLKRTLLGLFTEVLVSEKDRERIEEKVKDWHFDGISRYQDFIASFADILEECTVDWQLYYFKLVKAEKSIEKVLRMSVCPNANVNDAISRKKAYKFLHDELVTRNFRG
jgi:hypothetical protein